MPLTIPPGPEAGLPLVAKALDDLLPRRAGLRHFSDSGPAVSSRPLRVYVAGPEQLAGDGRIDAEPVGWRYLAEADEGVVAIELWGGPDGGPAFSQMRRGAGPDALARACALAEQIAAHGPDYELRILSAPALHMEALWLAAPESDRFITFKAVGDAVDTDFRELARAKSQAWLRTRPDAATGELGG